MGGPERVRLGLGLRPLRGGAAARPELERLSIGIRAPFDWDALAAWTEQVMPAFGARAVA